MLKRKIDEYLINWKKDPDKKPLILGGARQVGKTTAIKKLGSTYKSFIEINFLTMPKYKNIFQDGFSVSDVIKNISLINPDCEFIEKDTLILFDEIQAYPDAITSIKPFAIDSRFDVICTGSLLGINYKNITSIPVGYKSNYIMYPLDFEEFLWAKGYNEKQIDDMYFSLVKKKPLSSLYMDVMKKIYKEYIFVGGMPEVVQSFIDTNLFDRPFNIQKRIYKDYEDDITKYIVGLDAAKVKNIYRHITPQLAKENHKFQITTLGHGARSRDYKGIEEWLVDSGIINVAYNLKELEAPLELKVKEEQFKIYYMDHSLFISSLDDETRLDIVTNNNYEFYNGALYENLISEDLVKQGYKLYYYKRDNSTLEEDFFLRNKDFLIPVEVKANSNKSKSLSELITNNKYSEIKFGFKLSKNNIGYSNHIYTFPYFCSFLMKRFLKEFIPFEKK